jgi:hypothetical protein
VNSQWCNTSVNSDTLTAISVAVLVVTKASELSTLESYELSHGAIILKHTDATYPVSQKTSRNLNFGFDKTKNQSVFR